MLMISCDCDAALGLPHMHLYKFGYWKTDVIPYKNQNFSVFMDHETDKDDPAGIWMSVPIPDQVKIWVDWRKVGMELMREYLSS